MKLYITGSSFNPEDKIFTTELSRYFQQKSYGSGLNEIILSIAVVNISDYSGSLARSPEFNKGRFEYEYTITISSYYDVVSPSEYVDSVFCGLEMLKYSLPKGIDFDLNQFLSDAKQFVSNYAQ